MLKKACAIIIIIMLNLSLGWTSLVFAHSEAANYLSEIAIKYYNRGANAAALHEFNKALMIDPQNSAALEYVQKINSALSSGVLDPAGRCGIKADVSSPAKKHPPAASDYSLAPAKTKEDFARTALISKTLDEFSFPKQPVNQRQQQFVQNQNDTPAAEKIVPLKAKKEKKSSQEAEPLIKMTGEAQAALGVDSKGDAIWKKANFDLNERNWRMLSSDGDNNRENTYDPMIYDRLKINLDTPKDKNGFDFHTNITIDPWSFTGKTDKVNIAGAAGGDNADIELKYWSNTGYTLNQSVWTLKNGDTFNLPEIQVKDGKTVPTTVSTTWGNIFTIPALEVHREFQPLRELWVDYQQDDTIKLRVFPLATEKEAYTSDDPLKLSNNRIFWEDSPWLSKWQKGVYNSGVFPVSFTKGYWDDAISYGVRDSSGERLTALRGFSFNYKPFEQTTFDSTWAAPKDPWQDYSSVDNLSGATRIKQAVLDNLNMGATHTLRLGFIDDGSEIDSRNNVLAGDMEYEMKPGTKLQMEAALSSAQYDLSNSQYKTGSRGNAYYFALINRYPRQAIIDANYDQIQPEKNEPFMSKLKFFGAYMSKEFDPALSNYRQTRRDSFWARHLHFRQPLEYFYSGISSSTITIADIKPFAVGNGIDIDRRVLGLSWETNWDKKVNNLLDIRKAQTVQGKYLETEARDELSWKVNERLTAKALGIYQDLPKTKAGVDPFLYDNLTGENLVDRSADPIDQGKDPSLKTGSLGLEYAFTDWLSVNGIYECTNDYTLAYDNFPRRLLNDSEPSYEYYEDGNTYLKNRYFLYNQHYFPQPPYPFYNVFKTGVRILPIEKLEVYLDYTRNEFEKAGQISDGMNHFGAEIGWLPTAKSGLYLRYTYSLWQDLADVQRGLTKTSGHHNLFAALRYLMSKDDEFILEYGVSPNYPITELVSNDPFGGSLATIDTQHIIRFFYRRKF